MELFSLPSMFAEFLIRSSGKTVVVALGLQVFSVDIRSITKKRIVIGPAWYLIIRWASLGHLWKYRWGNMILICYLKGKVQYSKGKKGSAFWTKGKECSIYKNNRCNQTSMNVLQSIKRIYIIKFSYSIKIL